jgi:hypothetical protein
MDVCLHAERLVSTRARVSAPRVHPAEIPHGTMVTFPTDENDRSAWLVLDGKLWRWSFAGYSLAMPVAAVQEAALITAPAMVATLAAGYRPHIHASARDGGMEHPLHAPSLPPPLGTTRLPGTPTALGPTTRLAIGMLSSHARTAVGLAARRRPGMRRLDMRLRMG